MLWCTEVKWLKFASVHICTLHRSQIYNPAEDIIAAKYIKQQAITIPDHMGAWTNKISIYNWKWIPLFFFAAMWTNQFSIIAVYQSGKKELNQYSSPEVNVDLL